MENVSKKYEIDYQREFKGGWVAVVSDGEVYYQTGNNAWPEFVQFLEDNNLKINRLGVKFMDHVEWLPEGDGYYAVNGVEGVYGLNWSIPKCNIGFVKNNRLHMRHFKKPEMLLVDEDEREICQNTFLNDSTHQPKQ